MFAILKKMCYNKNENENDGRTTMIHEEKLTKVMDYIRKFSEKNGYTPSVREICQQCGIKSTATVHSYIEKLQDRGFLSRQTIKSVLSA